MLIHKPAHALHCSASPPSGSSAMLHAVRAEAPSQKLCSSAESVFWPRPPTPHPGRGPKPLESTNARSLSSACASPRVVGVGHRSRRRRRHRGWVHLENLDPSAVHKSRGRFPLLTSPPLY